MPGHALQYNSLNNNTSNQDENLVDQPKHHDIGAVENSVLPVYTVVTANGKPAVLLNIFRQPASNTVEVADAVHREIASLSKDLPQGIEIRPFYDQSELVNESIKSVRDAILLGLILASCIMVLFLRDFGTSLVAGLEQNTNKNNAKTTRAMDPLPVRRPSLR